MQENQQVVFMFDGGEDVRQVQEYLHPNSEHILDWFHITMRVTVLQQQTKALQAEATGGDGVSKQIDSVKHLLWHGNVAEAPERLASLFLGLDLMRKRSAPAEKLAAGIAEFETYIRNNRESIPKFGERYRQGETISTAFVESTINQFGQQALREETADAMDALRCAPATADPHESSQRRTGRSIPALVPEISPAAPNQHPGQGGLTPGLLLLSTNSHGEAGGTDRALC